MVLAWQCLHSMSTWCHSTLTQGCRKHTREEKVHHLCLGLVGLDCQENSLRGLLGCIVLVELQTSLVELDPLSAAY